MCKYIIVYIDSHMNIHIIFNYYLMLHMGSLVHTYVHLYTFYYDGLTIFCSKVLEKCAR